MADNDKEPLVDYPDDETESGMFRWISVCIVLLAVAGFFGLAWYAYKSGGEGVSDADVEEIKADKTPVKEAPANPGGMQIPNQDKTVYGLIAGKNSGDKPTVERILPAPEEPIIHNADGTETWMNEKIKNKALADKAENEQLAQVDSALTAPQETPAKAPPAAQEAAPPAVAAPEAKPAAKPAEQFTPPHNADESAVAAPPAEKQLPRTVTPPDAKPEEKPPAIKPEQPVASVPAPPVSSQPAPATPAAEEAVNDVKPAPKPVPATALPKGPHVQLGAFKSESEAKATWAHIAKTFSDDVEGKNYYVVRADLGEKGVYYRLQVAPFADAKEAESFCFDLISGGQGCFLAKAK